MAHMGDMISGLVGNEGTWNQGIAEAQGSVTDLSAHVDGGQPTATANSNAGADTTIIRWQAGLIFGVLLLLWLFGGIVFKKIRI